MVPAQEQDIQEIVQLGNNTHWLQLFAPRFFTSIHFSSHSSLCRRLRQKGKTSVRVCDTYRSVILAYAGASKQLRLEEADFTEGRVKLGLPSRRRHQCCSGRGAEVANSKRLITGRSAATWVLSQTGARLHGANLLPEAPPPLKHQGIRV